MGNVFSKTFMTKKSAQNSDGSLYYIGGDKINLGGSTDNIPLRRTSRSKTAAQLLEERKKEMDKERILGSTRLWKYFNEEELAHKYESRSNAKTIEFYEAMRQVAIEWEKCKAREAAKAAEAEGEVEIEDDQSISPIIHHIPVVTSSSKSIMTFRSKRSQASQIYKIRSIPEPEELTRYSFYNKKNVERLKNNLEDLPAARRRLQAAKTAGCYWQATDIIEDLPATRPPNRKYRDLWDMAEDRLDMMEELFPDADGPIKIRKLEVYSESDVDNIFGENALKFLTDNPNPDREYRLPFQQTDHEPDVTESDPRVRREEVPVDLAENRTRLSALQQKPLPKVPDQRNHDDLQELLPEEVEELLEDFPEIERQPRRIPLQMEKPLPRLPSNMKPDEFVAKRQVDPRMFSKNLTLHKFREQRIGEGASPPRSKLCYTTYPHDYSDCVAQGPWRGQDV